MILAADTEWGIIPLVSGSRFARRPSDDPHEPRSLSEASRSISPIGLVLTLEKREAAQEPFLSRVDTPRFP